MKIKLSISTFFLTIGLYIFSQDCNDGVKNGLEVDIDCGGLCDPCTNGIDGTYQRDSLNAEFPYALWLPKGYDSNNPYLKFPLIVFLHGNGEVRGNDPEKPRTTTFKIQNSGPMKYVNETWWNYPFIIVNPIRPNTNSTAHIQDIHSFIERISLEYHIDESRIFLTGLSGGSFVLSNYIKTFPEKMAALATIAGYAPTFKSSNCFNFKGLPLWYFHNQNDGTVVFSENSIDDIDWIENCSEPSPDPFVNTSIFQNGGHNSWSKVYNPNGSANDYLLSDLSFIDSKYNDYQVPYGLINNVPSIYDWFLSFENIPNHCRNEIQDGDETGIDCGGSCKDCSRTVLCRNGVLDAGETAIDCGGNCPPCERDVIFNNGIWNANNGPIESDQTIILDDFSGEFTTNHLLIESGKLLTVSGTLEVKGELVNKGTLIVPSGSSLITYEGNSIMGDIIVQRRTRYADGRYSYVGTPIQQNEFNTASQLGSNVYTFDESLSSDFSDLARWVTANPSDELIPGKGYTQSNKQDIEFVGQPNTGTIIYTGTYINDGWHLISNPYTAAINIDSFIDNNQNITGAIYLWDDNNSALGRGTSGDYIVANKLGATDTSGPDNENRWNGHIGSAQGFFVQLDNSAGNILFTESMRVSGNNSDENFFRIANNTALLKVNLKNEKSFSKQILIGWNEDFSIDEIVKGYDAPIINENAKNQLSSIKSNKQLAIQSTNFNVEEIPISYAVENPGTYSFSFKVDELTTSYYLFDKKTNYATEIIADNSYNFMTDSGKFTDRFVLTSEPTILGVQQSKLNVYTIGKTLYFNTDYNKSYRLKIYDLHGKKVKDLNIQGSGKMLLNDLRSGIYIVTDNFKSHKVILK